MKKNIVELNGVLEKSYARDRLVKPELIYRYKIRALVVSKVIGEYVKKLGAFSVLDFGSADGLTLLELKYLMKNGEFTGVELSEELILSAPPLGNSIRLIQGNITNLHDEIKVNSFDVVSALSVIGCLPDPSEAVKVAYRSLKPGGILIITWAHPVWDKISTKLGLLQADSHNVLTKDDLISLVRKNRFELLRFRYFMWIPISFMTYFRIPVSARLSLSCDELVNKLKIFNLLFANQYLVAQKPG